MCIRGPFGPRPRDASTLASRGQPPQDRTGLSDGVEKVESNARMPEPRSPSNTRSDTASPQEPGTNPSASRKRARSVENGNPEQQPQPERKKRAPTACRMCKNRKIKCSNDRPKCLSCVRLQCECVYPEDLKRPLEDESSQRILGALEEILARLPDYTKSSPSPNAPNTTPSTQVGLALPTDSGSKHGTTLHDLAAEDTFLSLPTDVSKNTSLDEVFRWPMFSSRIHIAGLQLSRLLMNDQESGHDDASDLYRKNAWHALDNTKILLHVNQFLANVNIKNPILDRHSLLKDAMVLTETGPTWDSRSCLVVRIPPGV